MTAADLARSAYTADAVRAAERPLIEAGEPLMARAAAALAARADAMLAGESGTVLVVAGRGDNGGDALFAAATLANEGHAVEILLSSDGAHQDALSAARRAGARCIALDDLRRGGTDYVLVIDGMVGIGASASSALRGASRAIVQTLLTRLSDDDGGRRPRVLAVDLPSGLHPDDGSADDVVLVADETLTFGAMKAGLVRGRGPELVGSISVVDLGLAEALGRVRPAVIVEPPVPVVRERQRA